MVAAPHFGWMPSSAVLYEAVIVAGCLLCVVFALNRSFYPTTSVNPKSVLIHYPREILLYLSRAAEPLPILNPSNFVPKNGFPVVEGLRRYPNPFGTAPTLLGTTDLELRNLG